MFSWGIDKQHRCNYLIYGTGLKSNSNKFHFKFKQILLSHEIILWKRQRCSSYWPISRDGSRTAVTSKMELSVIIVNGLQPLTITTKNSTLDVAGALDLPLMGIYFSQQHERDDFKILKLILTSTLQKQRSKNSRAFSRKHSLKKSLLRKLE